MLQMYLASTFATERMLGENAEIMKSFDIGLTKWFRWKTICRVLLILCENNRSLTKLIV